MGLIPMEHNLLKSKEVTVTIPASYTTGSGHSYVPRNNIVSVYLEKSDDVYYTPITFSVFDNGVIECRAFTAPTEARTYTFMVWYLE